MENEQRADGRPGIIFGAVIRRGQVDPDVLAAQVCLLQKERDALRAEVEQLRAALDALLVPTP